MDDLLNKSFFKFLFGFLGILALSFVVMALSGFVLDEGTSDLPLEAGNGAAALDAIDNN